METSFFCFGLHLILAEKRTWFWAGKFSFWSSLILNFLDPPFENPAYATEHKRLLEHSELDSFFTNMVAKTGLAYNFQNLGTNETENCPKIKSSLAKPKIYWFL